MRRRDRYVGQLGQASDLFGINTGVLGGLTPGTVEIPLPGSGGGTGSGGGGGGTSLYDLLVLATPGLSYYWPLNETSGTVAHELLHGSLNGVYTGGYTLAQAGAGSSSNAVLLDGSSGYVQVPTTPGLDAGLTLSLEVWYRLANPIPVGIFDTLLNRVDGSLTVGYALELDGNGNIDFTSWDAAGGTDNSLFVGSFDTAWHHLVATSDQTSADFWFDGHRISHGSSFLTATSTVNTKPLYFGHSLAADEPTGSVDTFFDGELQRIAIYSTVMSSSDIAAHYAAGIA